ncbi:MAG: hypothetical protein IH892_23220, partial [Planctomycetes bacterium]|nr:hypothetical protein [Planctomycetota bacterium]
MIRIKGHALLCAFVALSMLLMLQPASAQNFFADFEDGIGVNDPSQWVPENAGQAWGIADFPGGGKGLKNLNEGCGTTGNTPLPGVTDFTDGIIQLDMSWDDDDSWGVILRQTAADAGYLVFFGYVETGSVIIADLADGCGAMGQCLSDQAGCENGGVELISVPHGLTNLTQDLSVSYTGRIEVRGDTIKVWYLPTADIADPLGDLGPPLVELQTTAHAGPGSVGIWQESQGGCMIDNVLVMVGDPGQAGTPNPANGAKDVERDVVLSWAPGEFANTRNVSFGTSFTDVNEASAADPRGVSLGQGLTDTSIDAGRLDFGETYYWRVDEVNGAPDRTVFKGNVWNFQVEPFSIPISNITVTASSEFGESTAQRTIDGSGLVDDLHGTDTADMWISGGIPATIEYAFDRAYKLHELWVWNSNQLIEAFLGFGAKDVVIETSLDGANWTVLEGVGPLAQATGIEGYAHNSTIDFGGATARHVRMTINTVQGFVQQASLSEVRFFYIPTFATQPNPESGASDVAPDVTLAWGRDGREADHHDVYVGTDAN